MSINVMAKPDDKPEQDFTIMWCDAELIKEIAAKVGPIQAMKVTRWLTKCSLRTAKDFVDGLTAAA